MLPGWWDCSGSRQEDRQGLWPVVSHSRGGLSTSSPSFRVERTLDPGSIPKRMLGHCPRALDPHKRGRLEVTTTFWPPEPHHSPGLGQSQSRWPGACLVGLWSLSLGTAASYDSFPDKSLPLWERNQGRKSKPNCPYFFRDA